MKDAYFFSHDANALDDPKIAALICKYGFSGYGWFWAIIELLRQQADYKYPMRKYTFDAFAKRLQCDRDAVTNYINDCCHEFADDKGALLCMDENYIWSESLIRRMQSIDKRRESARNSALARWDKNDKTSDANAMRTQCGPNAVKESKVKDICSGKKFIPPTIEQIKEYCIERNNTIDSQKWFDHYTANGWMIGKNKMKDWKASVRTWEQKEKSSQYRRIS